MIFSKDILVLLQRFPHTRIVLERPFGADLKSARALHESLTLLFQEEQIYRIDHFVAKWWIQNILALHFANIFFEPIWNHNYIDNIQITSNESLTIGNRGMYYETAWALRDMVQNHLFQILALVLMRRPVDLSAESIRQAKTEILKSLTIKNIHEDVVFGQYIGYQKEKGVASDSRMETFVALRLESSIPQYTKIPRGGLSHRRRKTLLRKMPTRSSSKMSSPEIILSSSLGICSRRRGNSSMRWSTGKMIVRSSSHMCHSLVVQKQWICC